MKRIGVVGAGPMGRLHARTVHRLAGRGGDFELACIFDRHRGRADALANEFGARAAGDLRGFAEQLDVAIVSVPTAAHFKIARALLERGLDLLIEKPFTSEIGEAEALIETARTARRILQVGHVEWYNPIWRSAAERVGRLRRIEVDRLQPPGRRGRDIDVIQDLMLHDLDWTTRWIERPLLEVAASGRTVRGRLEEVDAELSFEGGCRVRLRSSRLHDTRERAVRFEGEKGNAQVDLDGLAPLPSSPSANDCEAGSRMPEGAPAARCPDPLEAQWVDFMLATTSRIEPVNSGAVGIAALELVARVRKAIESGPVPSGQEREP